MELRSSLYECEVVHYRLQPRRHWFRATMFMFYLDLDELDQVGRSLPLIGYNRRAVYRFDDRDHSQETGKTAKAYILDKIRREGVGAPVSKVYLLTCLRTFGYVFNPVSFYICCDEQDDAVCVVAEVSNTFRETKYFVLGADTCREGGRFVSRRAKDFYVSPFNPPDVDFAFDIRRPGERLMIRIDNVSPGAKKFLFATLKGSRLALTRKNILRMTMMYPLITLKVMALIHWHALILFLKRIPFRWKEAEPEKQKEVHRVWYKNGRPTSQACADR